MCDSYIIYNLLLILIKSLSFFNDNIPFSSKMSGVGGGGSKSGAQSNVIILYYSNIVYVRYYLTYMHEYGYSMLWYGIPAYN